MSVTFEATEVLSILRDGRARTKSELAEITGRARSTISTRLEELVATGLVEQLDRTASTKGRPSSLYALSTDKRLIGAIELGARHGLVAVTDLAGTVLTHRSLDLDIASGPQPVLDQSVAVLTAQLADLGRPATDLIGVGIALPGPVEHESGLPISPPIMPGWDRFDVVAYIAATFPVPVIVDNDVNVMALGEAVSVWPDERDLLMVKVATGIGAGVIAGGHIIRGAQGAGGDIGHIQIGMAEGRQCRCGQLGCLEALASGSGIAETLRRQGIEARDSADVVRLVRAGDLAATKAVREAGRAIGQVLAACICVLNPSLIVLGGDMARVGEPLLAGIREVVYQRSQPLATQQLRVVAAQNVELAGALGASRLVQDLVFGLSD